MSDYNKDGIDLVQRELLSRHKHMVLSGRARYDPMKSNYPQPESLVKSYASDWKKSMQYAKEMYDN